jgi:hypothetical protein
MRRLYDALGKPRPRLNGSCSHIRIFLHYYRVANLLQPANLSLAQNCTWATSNLCRGKPAPPMELMQPFIKPLTNLLAQTLSNPDLKNSFELQTDIVWCLSYISDGDDERIQAVMETGVLPLLMQLVDQFPDNRALMTPTVRCIGNFATGNDIQTDAVLDGGFLRNVGVLLETRAVSFVDVCRTPSFLKCSTNLTSVFSLMSTEKCKEGCYVDSLQRCRRHACADHKALHSCRPKRSRGHDCSTCY